MAPALPIDHDHDHDNVDAPPPPYYNDSSNGVNSKNNAKKTRNSGQYVHGHGSEPGASSRVNEPLLGYHHQPPTSWQRQQQQQQQAGWSSQSYSQDNSDHHDDDDDQIDDFMYGTTVSSSSIKVRHAFIVKVYTALFIQLLGTVIVGAALYTTDAKYYVQANAYCFWVPLVASLVSMVALYIYRQQYPANIFLLGTFTLAESLSVGTVVTFFDSQVVLLALVITLFLVLGLTLFAFQTKYDFSSMGGYLYGALLAFILVGIATIFFPFSRTLDAVYAGVGVLLFSGILIYDTQMIMRRLSHEEWIIAVISLYLDIINLFMNILRLLNSARDD